MLEKPVTANSRESWVSCLYEAVSACESDDGGEFTPDDIDDMKTALAWICDELAIDPKHL